MKSQKGITLIALIITIIVMLILVAVSITLLTQSGIFNQAQAAATGYGRQGLTDVATAATANGILLFHNNVTPAGQAVSTAQDVADAIRDELPSGITGTVTGTGDAPRVITIHRTADTAADRDEVTVTVNVSNGILTAPITNNWPATP